MVREGGATGGLLGDNDLTWGPHMGSSHGDLGCKAEHLVPDHCPIPPLLATQSPLPGERDRIRRTHRRDCAQLLAGV